MRRPKIVALLYFVGSRDKYAETLHWLEFKRFYNLISVYCDGWKEGTLISNQFRMENEQLFQFHVSEILLRNNSRSIKLCWNQGMFLNGLKILWRKITTIFTKYLLFKLINLRWRKIFDCNFYFYEPLI